MLVKFHSVPFATCLLHLQLLLQQEGGIKGRWRNQVLPTLPPNLGNIWGCLAYSEFFSVDIKCLPLAKSHLENTMGNIFFIFLNTDQNAPIFFRTVIIQHFIRNLLSKLILDHKKCPNQKTCSFTFMHFQVGELPKVQVLYYILLYEENIYI